MERCVLVRSVSSWGMGMETSQLDLYAGPAATEAAAREGSVA